MSSTPVTGSVGGPISAPGNGPLNVRVRFAPSPTGYLHVGGLRTALYNYLFARKHGGTFILRIEDTDRTRYVEGAVENLQETLKWAGLEFDEGPGTGAGTDGTGKATGGGPAKGDRGPYVQSERLAIYREHAARLLEASHAYPCFCTPERLEAMRKEQERLKLPPKYDRTCARLTKAEGKARTDAGEPHVLRLRVPEAETVTVHDLIRGDVEFQTDRLDDQVLMKSDGYPTYHLANVVDDRLMGITHVIRGEEWLSSTPKHVLLYRGFGWNLPAFAHLPLLLNPDRSKLSKRQGDVAVEDYRGRGYLPSALVNFVALLGWNPGGEREIFSLGELVNEFSLERVGKSGAIFNIEKLDWINQQHLRALPDSELLARARGALTGAGINGVDDAYLLRVIHLMKDRLQSMGDLAKWAGYFFTEPDAYDPDAKKKNWVEGSGDRMVKLAGRLESAGSYDEQSIEASVKEVAAEAGVGAGKIIHAARLAVSGISIGPGLYELLAVLGKERVARRLRKAAAVLGVLLLAVC